MEGGQDSNLKNDLGLTIDFLIMKKGISFSIILSSTPKEEFRKGT
jgi:hypothetical protein